VTVAADVFYLMVATQILYLVWNAKSFFFYVRADRDQLFADSANPLPDGSMNLPKITAILTARNELEPVLRRSLLSLCSLDYPVEKKEILLVTDFDDVSTGTLADRLSRELGLTHVVVPKNDDPSWNLIISQARNGAAKWADINVEQLPNSKPRALTYALSRATGQIVSVVDAEDVQGDPLVFRKAAQCLQDEGYDAVQGRLRFINYRDSWLSLQSVGDYAFWFAFLLPKIRIRGLPVALGGTCYYIRRDVLDAVGGWDPTNVTEDLELGLRLYGYGYHVGIIDVDTYEEAPRKLLRSQSEGGWANQRTRWIRGTLYTVARLGMYWKEFSLRKRFGISFLMFFYLLGFLVPFLSIVGYPLMVLSILIAILLPIESLTGYSLTASLVLIQDPWLAAISFLNMLLLLWHVLLTVRGIAGTVGKTIQGIPEKIHFYGLAAVTIMFYWVLWGLPVLRAVWQILSGARFWEKTLHEGLHHPVLDRI
jgi:cellulose synthase/poly-beta-1,6-N-acetylglucosamine synthase-like glycosyltransferase